MPPYSWLFNWLLCMISTIQFLHILALVFPHSHSLTPIRFNFGGYRLIKRDFDVSQDPLPDIEKSTTAELTPEPPTFSFADSARKTLSMVSRIATRKPEPCVHKPSETWSSCETALPTTDNINTPGKLKEILGITPAITSTPKNTAPTFTRRLWTTIQPFITPPAISLVFSLIIANVPTLKALFVQTTDVNMPPAPDQKPPLDFVMEIAIFAGPTVPVLGMLLLGAALSRLSMGGLPQGFWKAVVMMAGLKLVVGELFFCLFFGKEATLSESKKYAFFIHFLG